MGYRNIKILTIQKKSANADAKKTSSTSAKKKKVSWFQLQFEQQNNFSIDKCFFNSLRV